MSATLAGEWGTPVNTSAHQKGGIHDDDTATDLGFRGGTVAGSIHMEQFLPLLLDAFSEAWWRNGVLSMYFRQATVDRQPVRCFLTPSDSGQAKVWMENEDQLLCFLPKLTHHYQIVAMIEHYQLHLMSNSTMSYLNSILFLQLTR